LKSFLFIDYLFQNENSIRSYVTSNNILLVISYCVKMWSFAYGANDSRIHVRQIVHPNTGASIPPKPMMHIAYSPFSTKIYSPYFRTFSGFGYPLLWTWCIYTSCFTRTGRPCPNTWIWYSVDKVYPSNP